MYITYETNIFIYEREKIEENAQNEAKKREKKNF